MNLWPVEHFCPPFFSQISATLLKNGGKSVQLVRGSFLPSDFLQNPYFYTKYQKRTTYLPLLLVLIPESPLDEASRVRKPRIGATEASKLLTINESMKFSLSSEIKFFGDLDSRNLADWWCSHGQFWEVTSYKNRPGSDSDSGIVDLDRELEEDADEPKEERMRFWKRRRLLGLSFRQLIVVEEVAWSLTVWILRGWFKEDVDREEATVVPKFISHVCFFVLERFQGHPQSVNKTK